MTFRPFGVIFYAPAFHREGRGDLMPERGTMKPIIEITAAHVGKQLRIVDQHLSIEGTLASLRVWSESEEIREAFGRLVKTMTALFVEVEVAGIDGTTQLTRQAEFEVIE
jgi:hypothetical protein